MQDIKSKIKVVAAALAGGLMLGATMAGAVAADLGSLPTGFVSNNGWQAQIVVGQNAKVADVIAAAQISAAMAPYTVSASASGTTSTSSGKTEEVAIGGTFSKTMTTGLYPTLLSSGKYTVYEGGSTKHEIPYVEYYSVSGAQVDAFHDLTSVTDDTSSLAHQIYAKLSEGAIKYYLEFKGGVNDTWIDSDNPLELNLLGYNLKITSFDSSAHTITVRIGEPKPISEGASAEVNGHTVTVTQVVQDSSNSYAAYISVDGSSAQKIAKSQSKTFTVGGEEVQVTVDDISVPWDPSAGKPLVKVLVGSETSKTYENGDGFLSEADKDNPVNWKWYINFDANGKLTQLGVQNVAKNGYDTTDTTNNMIPMGEAFSLPDNSITFKLDSLTTDADHYYVKTYISNGKTLVTINNDYGFQAGNGADYTNKLELLGTYLSAGKLLVKYKTTLQSDPDYTEFNVSLTQDGVSDVNDGTNDWYINTGSAGQDIKLQIVDLTNGGNDFSAANYTPGLRFYITATGENITIPLQNAASMTYLGTSLNDDANETAYSVSTTTSYIGDRDYKTRLNYGGYIKAGKDVDDTVEFYLPVEQAKVNVYVGAPSAATSTTGVSYTYAPITSEVAVLDSEANTNQPVIIVGGPYANSLAAQLIGTDDATIRTFFGADQGGLGVVKLYDSSETPWSQPAMLVAGWAAKDTRAAAYVLSEYLTGSRSLSELSGKTTIKVTASTPTSISNIEKE